MTRPWRERPGSTPAFRKGAAALSTPGAETRTRVAPAPRPIHIGGARRVLERIGLALGVPLPGVQQHAGGVLVQVERALAQAEDGVRRPS
jgi:hypothetical protein